MRKNSEIIIGLLVILLFILGCDRSENQNAILQVRLTDAPGEYDQVLIDVRDVQIHVSDNEDQGSWQSLHVNKGVYNLLEFRSGIDTLLAYIELPAGTLSQMRLVLGSDNRVIKDGESHNLDTPSAQQSGLKFNIHANLTEGIVYKLWIDFDAQRSIVHKGNGRFSLKPVIRTFTNATSGAIRGIVSPAESFPYVMAVANGDTLGTQAAQDGNFLLKAVPEGIYSVIFDPVDSFSERIIDQVSVVNGQVTDLDSVYISPM